jgi:hypothetical protein
VFSIASFTGSLIPIQRGACSPHRVVEVGGWTGNPRQTR